MFLGACCLSLSRPHFSTLVTPATLVGPNAENKIQSKSNITLEGNKDRIKKMFDKVELSVSCYDTAWAAMIPSPTSPQAPLFPQSLNWLLENQLIDGSWGLPDRHELLTKDSLLSTLACVLALKQWGVGEQQTNRGLQYVESNIASAHDDKQHSPIGFDIIFSHLIKQAQKMDLNLPLGRTSLETFIRKRQLELERGRGSNSEGWKAYIAYISEGLGKSQNWEMAMKYQRKNGSLFNSPAATAAAFIHLGNPQCLDYLVSLLDIYENAVPTLHPLNIYARLYMVDSLEKLGIDRHFKEEIRSVLDETYRMWQEEEEDIFLEPTTCATAFRLLRLHRYDVSSGALSQFSEGKFSNSLQGYLRDVEAVEAVLELHKASQIVLHSEDSVLKELNSWTRYFLEEYLSSSSKHIQKPINHIDHEVRFAVRFPHHTYLDRILNRKTIQNYKVDQKRILKTSYSSLNLANKEFLELAAEDFNHCQLVFHEEFERYNRWFKDSGMDNLEFPRPKVAYSYLTAAGTLVSPQLSESRLSWATNALLTCVIDDFYDVWGCEEDQKNLLKLMQKWDVDVNRECSSETVKILFLALKGVICEIADQAFKVQGRSVLSHLKQLWGDVLRAYLKEAEWLRSKYVPSMDEYLRNSITSMTLGPIVLSALYLVGPKLPQETVESAEYNQLYEVLSLYGRLFNDINGYKREIEQGRLNSVALQLIQGSGAITMEEIVEKTMGNVDEKRKELLRLVLQEKGSIVPGDIKDVFRKMAKSLHVTSRKEDVVHASEMPDELFNIKDAVMGDPIVSK